ncbi:MAG: arginine N-succinyltransferase [Gammaproteobacteria bacterium]|nr:arginine N-succinyltransferase [Gammaproteobacteria bacterium]
MESNTSWRPGCLMTTVIIIVTIALSTALTIWILNTYIFPTRFSPVELSEKEQKTLDKKIAIFSQFGGGTSSEPTQSESSALEPEQYTESDESRLISLTERELNGLLANNTDLSERFAIDLSDKLASGKLLIKPDPDFPILGGKTVKLTAGLELGYENERPIIKLRGVSIMGVPIPNAWLGGLKNVDLIQEFGADEGVWKSFADGVEMIKVQDDKLVIQLKE